MNDTNTNKKPALNHAFSADDKERDTEDGCPRVLSKQGPVKGAGNGSWSKYLIWS